MANDSFKVLIDWNADGLGVDDDMTAYVRRVRIKVGIADPMARIASVGTCTLTVNNLPPTLPFTPNNSGGPFYGQLLPRRAVQIQVTNGATGLTYNAFTGFTHRIIPASGQNLEGNRSADIECYDLFGILQKAKIAVPLQLNQRADQLIPLILNSALNAPAASATLNFLGTPANGDTVTINGIIYTLVSALGASANQVLIGTRLVDTLSNLVNAIDNGPGVGTIYTVGTVRPANITAAPNVGYYSNVMADNPVRYYRLGEKSNAVPAADNGSNNSAGTFQGTITVTAPAAPINDPDTSVLFNGTNAYVSLPPLDLANRSFTVEGWLFPGSTPPTQQDWFGAHSASSSDQSIFCRVYSDGSLTFGFYGDDLTTAPGAVSMSGWNYVVCTYNYTTATQTIYVNGVSKGSRTVSSSFVGAAPMLTIGASFGGNNFFKGYLDEIALYLKAFSAADTLRHYNARVAPFGVLATATMPGTPGNSYPVSAVSSALSWSGSTLTGGGDYPTSPAPLLETGRRTFDIAADLWAKDKTNALTALQQVVESEFGLIWVARDGTVTFKNQSYQFRQTSSTGDIGVNGTGVLNGALNEEQVYNKITVQFTPRNALAQAVVASTNAPVLIPGKSGVNRYNPYTPLVNPSGATKIITLPFVDPVTGQPMGAQSIVLPLVPNVDYTANEAQNGSGTDYAAYTPQVFFVSAVINGSNVELSVRNEALGPIYLTSAKVRGVGIVSYNPLSITQEDATSQAAYGKSDLTIPLPLPSGQVYAESLAYYLLRKFKDPQYRVQQITFDRLHSTGGVFLLSLDLGQVMIISDSQTALTSRKYLITGASYQWSAGLEGLLVTFDIRALDDVTFWILGDSVYGVLGSTTRLAI